MQGRFYDGVTAAPHAVDVSVADGALCFRAGGRDHAWPLDGLQTEGLGERVRLSEPGGRDGRLLLDAADWRAAAGALARLGETRERTRERRLVLGLALAGLAVVAFVFVGMPALSGPMARATPPALERRMGESFEVQLSAPFRACKGDAAGQRALQALGRRLARETDSPFDIRVRAVEAPFANAFALPGGPILVTDDLIRLAETPDELAAVVAHEVAHVERRHVMQAVWRTLGLGLVLDAVVGGGSGAGQQAVLLAGSFADLRYSRQAETEADARGMALLEAAGLSSQGMAPFFERMGGEKLGSDAALVRELVSSHPDSLRRASVSRAMARPGAAAFGAAEWAAVKAACGKAPKA